MRSSDYLLLCVVWTMRVSGCSGGRFQLLDQLMEKMAAVLESRVDINTSSLDAIVRMYGVTRHDDTTAAAPHAHTCTWMMLVGVLAGTTRTCSTPGWTFRGGETAGQAAHSSSTLIQARVKRRAHAHMYIMSLAAFRYQHTPFARMQSGFFRRKKQGSARLSLKATVKKVSVPTSCMDVTNCFLEAVGQAGTGCPEAYWQASSLVKPGGGICVAQINTAASFMNRARPMSADTMRELAEKSVNDFMLTKPIDRVIGMKVSQWLCRGPSSAQSAAETSHVLSDACCRALCPDDRGRRLPPLTVGSGQTQAEGHVGHGYRPKGGAEQGGQASQVRRNRQSCNCKQELAE